MSSVFFMAVGQIARIGDSTTHCVIHPLKLTEDLHVSIFQEESPHNFNIAFIIIFHPHYEVVTICKVTVFIEGICIAIEREIHLAHTFH